MKRILSGIFIIAVLFSSCKKEKAKSNLDTHAVTFNVSGFSQQLTNFDVTKKKLTSLAVNPGKLAINADTSFTNHASVLYYFVYDSQGTLLHSIKQLSTDADFGLIKDNLHIGSYTAVFAAGTNHSNAVGSTLSSGYLSYFYAATYYYNQDAFLKKITLNVTNSDVTTPVTLNRVVGQLLLNIEDAIPAKAAYLTVSTSDGFLAQYNFGSLSPSGTMKTPYTFGQNLTAADIGVKNHQISFLTFNTITPFSITLQVLDSSGVVVAQKVISNVTCYPNKITLLTGFLFGGNGTSSTGGLTLGIDSTWAGSTTIPF